MDTVCFDCLPRTNNSAIYDDVNAGIFQLIPRLDWDTFCTVAEVCPIKDDQLQTALLLMQGESG